MKRRPGLWLLVLALAGCDAGPRTPAHNPPGERSGAPDVWLITLDTFRADRAGAYGNPQGLTPSLDRLMRGGLIAANAYAPVPLTAPSHATILTGLIPPHHGVRDNGSYPLAPDHPRLSTLLAEEGFSTGAFVAALPLVSRFGFAVGFDEFDESLRSSANGSEFYAERPAREVVAAASAWIRSLSSEKRWFLWTHFFDPHYPLLPPPPLDTLPDAGDYEREIRAMDSAIGSLTRDLEDARDGHRPLVAIVSDHGESLGEFGESSHGYLVQEPTMRGVLAIHAPAGTVEAGRLQPDVRRHVVSYADVLPTLLDVLAFDALRGDGVSLARGEPSSAGAYGESWYPALHHGWSPLTCWRDDRWTYVEGPSPRLYDRVADPREQRNVIADHADLVARFAAEIAARDREPAPPDASLDPADVEKLAALGYTSVTGDELSYDRAKDPYERIHSVNDLFRGMNLVREGHALEALKFLRRAYNADSSDAMSTFQLANGLRLAGQETAALRYYRRAVDITPRAAEAFAHMALIEASRGRRDEAFRLLEEGLAHNPDAFPLRVTTGDLRAEAGDVDVARRCYERAAEIEKLRPEPWRQLAALARARGEVAEATRLGEKARALEFPEDAR
ncbi:MAG: sulfatase-like hydrolase/transferase [Gemmatimonadetes bacterium]|nr:sulfatase-like hydrolase/transferase [Gemmatimonadota bacterium]